jgi:IS6 family transposase
VIVETVRAHRTADIISKRRDVVELLTERGIKLDHVTIHRWVQRFTPLVVETARPCRHSVGDSWFVDDTYTSKLPASGATCTGQSTDTARPSTYTCRNSATSKRRPGSSKHCWPVANNRIECDHRRLKARLRPTLGLRTDRTATVVIRGHAFIQNRRRGHYELGVEARHPRLRVAAAFDELITAT